MSELRLNLISREWVVITRDRARKPEEYRARGQRKHVPERDAACPFCPGNERKTPDELLRIPADGQWRVRVTPNKFSALAYSGERVRENVGLKRKVSGVGIHEMVIESDKHNASLAELGDDDVRDVLHACLERFQSAFLDKRIQHVLIFKNHGPDAGSSIIHPHTQLIGVPVMPLQIRYRVDEAMRYFDNTGNCLFCATVQDELADGTRVLVESESFVSLIPYSALSPFHIWIFPKRHMASFGNILNDELADLARVARRTLRMLHFGLDNPSYNMVIRTLSPYRSRSEYLHWYMSIMPQVTFTTGMELGSGMFVNPTLPEEAAEFLRGVRMS